MANYTYAKYSVIDTRVWEEQKTWTSLGYIGSYNSAQAGRISDRRYKVGYTFDSKTGFFSPAPGFYYGGYNNGTWFYTGPELDYYSLWESWGTVIKERKITRFYFQWVWPDANNVYRVFAETNTATFISGAVEKDTLVDKVIAEDGTYPDNGYNEKDGFWYVKGSIIVAAEITLVTPTHVYNKPSVISVKTVPTIGLSDVLFYSAKLNGADYIPYGSISHSLGVADIPVYYKDLADGQNTVTVTCKDNDNNESSATAIVYKEVPYRLKVERTFTDIDGGYIISE